MRNTAKSHLLRPASPLGLGLQRPDGFGFWRHGVLFRRAPHCHSDAGSHRFIFSFFHSLIPANKSVQRNGRGGIGSSDSDRLLFSTKFRAPPLSASLSAGERGGCTKIASQKAVKKLALRFEKSPGLGQALCTAAGHHHLSQPIAWVCLSHTFTVGRVHGSCGDIRW